MEKRMYELMDNTEEKLVKKIMENLKIPTLEDFKNAFFDEIKKVGIHETEEYIEEVFDPDSDIYSDGMYCYELYDILNLINKDFFGNHTLYMEMNSDYGIVCDLIDKLNPEIGEILDTCTMELSYDYRQYFTNDKDIDALAEDYHDQLEKELSIEELKAFIFQL